MIAKGPVRVLKPAGAQPVQAYALQALGGQSEEKQREQRAYERGLVDGERRAREETLAPLERQNALLGALGAEVRALREAVLRDAEEAVAALALEIAWKVVRERGEALRDRVVAQAQELVGRVRDGGPLRVLVHPQDVPVLEAARDVLAGAADGAALEVQGDPRISRGGCLVETPARLADARIEVQLARLGEALREQRDAR